MPASDPVPMSWAGSARLPSPPPPEPRPVNWTMVSVVAGLAVQAITLVAWLAVLENRVGVIEQQVPPGAFARLEERVGSIKDTVESIDRRLGERQG